MSGLTWDGAAKPVSRDQILRRERGQGNTHFPCLADRKQDWQPYPVGLYSAVCYDHTCINTVMPELKAPSPRVCRGTQPRAQRSSINRGQRTDPDPENFNAGLFCMPPAGSRVIGELIHSRERSETFPLNFLYHEVRDFSHQGFVGNVSPKGPRLKEAVPPETAMKRKERGGSGGEKTEVAPKGAGSVVFKVLTKILY